MPIRMPSSTDTSLSSIETMFSQTGPMAKSLSPATQDDILGIFQREQDRAVALLSSSPLLASLFVSYANRAAAFESASAAPSPECEEWKALQKTITTLQEEIKDLTSENLEMVEKLESAEASQEAFRSQVSSLKKANSTQQGDIKTLQAKLAETNDKYNRFVADSNAEKADLHTQVLDLEAERGELREAVVDQQIKISKLERQNENEEPSILPPVIIPRASTGTFDDTGKPGFTARQGSLPGYTEDAERRIFASSGSDTDPEQGLPPTKPTPPAVFPSIQKPGLGAGSAQSQVNLKPALKPLRAPVPYPQRPGGWGTWGSSLLNDIANATPTERPSPPSLPATPEINPRGTAWGGTTSRAKNLTVDTTTKPAGNIPEQAVEIKHVPAP